MPKTALRRPDGAPRSRARSTARLEARITPDLKAVIERAASLGGHASVTDYIIQALRESASRTVEASRRTRLDAQESKAFVQSLLVPEAPVSALRAAFAQYREHVG